MAPIAFANENFFGSTPGRLDAVARSRTCALKSSTRASRAFAFASTTSIIGRTPSTIAFT